LRQAASAQLEQARVADDAVFDHLCHAADQFGVG
jgi:hypothetical protein